MWISENQQVWYKFGSVTVTSTLVFMHTHENSASPSVNLQEYGQLRFSHNLWRKPVPLKSLFHSAEGSDLASTPSPPHRLVWPLHLCADHQVVTETQRYGEW